MHLSPRRKTDAYRLSLFHAQPCPKISAASRLLMHEKSLQIPRVFKMGLLSRAIKLIPDYITLT
ncbi:hypothetical protein ADU59_03185 [Pararhizobium polonicum]|jgi:hypothetical protein|uniref:Uncharacterized protein n=1 Tax=Pararhizobium polonicum TaxID=1612624 RepID=A0A1C7P622_9HYPH|nr:hypothetical protein ADU59_03185 [Pararhizobium polonicum]